MQPIPIKNRTKGSIQNAFFYLDKAVQKFVTAKSIFDKLVAIRLVVYSLTIAADTMIAVYSNIYQSSLNPDNLQASIIKTDSYEERAKNLMKLEKTIPKKITRPFIKAISYLTKLEQSKDPVIFILNLNFKEFQNIGLVFLLNVNNLLDNSNNLQKFKNNR